MAGGALHRFEQGDAESLVEARINEGQAAHVRIGQNIVLYLPQEIDARRGPRNCHDRVIFASDEPWSDFWGEYWKINGAPVGDELKQRILHQNFEELYTKVQ